MILVAAALLLVAVGLLATGIAQGSSALEWASFGASAAAALVLALGELRRRVRNRTAAPAAPAGEPAREPVSVTAAATAPTGATAAPAAPAEPREAPQPVQPQEAPHPVRPPEVPGPQTGRHATPDPAPESEAEVVRLAAPPVPPPPSRPDLPVVRPPAERAPALGADGEPPAEEVEFTDLLLIMDLHDEVLVVDEHPRYHLAGCPHLAGVEVIPVPMDQARTDGFTPCATCAPDRTLAARERARRAS